MRGKGASVTTSDTYQPIATFDEFIEEADFDPELFDAFSANFATTKAQVDDAALQRSVETATRWAAVDTGAIEGLYEVERGFTFSVAVSTTALDNAHIEVGSDVVRAIRDAIEGYDYVLDVATNSREVTEVWIKELHATICASQETYKVYTDAGPQERRLPKGEYKQEPNSPVKLRTGEVHPYAPPSDTGPEMARLVEQLKSSAFAAAHPVLQAAYAHYAFVCIHPFADGNGRVARALASTYVYRSPGVPLVIFADQKNVYLDALEAADTGDPTRFVDFIRDCVIDIMGMVREDLRREVRPAPRDRLRDLNRALQASQGLPHTEMDAIAIRITNEWSSALVQAQTDAGVQAPIGIQVGPHGLGRVPDWARPVKDLSGVALQGSCRQPASAAVSYTYAVRIPRAGTSTRDFVLTQSPNDEICDIALREAHPTISAALKYRLRVLADDAIARLVDELVAAGTAKLLQMGYTSESDAQRDH
jgi:Fic family protein